MLGLGPLSPLLMADVENILVAVRCRPLSSKEVARGCQSIVEFSGDGKTIKISPSSSSNGLQEDKYFTFDHCYDEFSEQRRVYQELGGPIVSNALEGYNATILAYGQTGLLFLPFQSTLRHPNIICSDIRQAPARRTV